MMQAGDESFNPTMVRLLPPISPKKLPQTFVSIPQWCDCCKTIKLLVNNQERFQSHNGAIAATMVRLWDVARQ